MALGKKRKNPRVSNKKKNKVNPSFPTSRGNAPMYGYGTMGLGLQDPTNPYLNPPMQGAGEMQYAQDAGLPPTDPTRGFAGGGGLAMPAKFVMETGTKGVRAPMYYSGTQKVSPNMYNANSELMVQQSTPDSFGEKYIEKGTAMKGMTDQMKTGNPMVDGTTAIVGQGVAGYVTARDIGTEKMAAERQRESNENVGENSYAQRQFRMQSAGGGAVYKKGAKSISIPKYEMGTGQVLNAATAVGGGAAGFIKDDKDRNGLLAAMGAATAIGGGFMPSAPGGASPIGGAGASAPVDPSAVGGQAGLTQPMAMPQGEVAPTQLGMQGAQGMGSQQPTQLGIGLPDPMGTNPNLMPQNSAPRFEQGSKGVNTKDVEIEVNETILRKDGDRYKLIRNLKGEGYKSHKEGGVNVTAQEGDIITPGKDRDYILGKVKGGDKHSKVNGYISGNDVYDIEAYRSKLPADVNPNAADVEAEQYSEGVDDLVINQGNPMPTEDPSLLAPRRSDIEDMQYVYDDTFRDPNLPITRSDLNGLTNDERSEADRLLNSPEGAYINTGYDIKGDSPVNTSNPNNPNKPGFLDAYQAAPVFPGEAKGSAGDLRAFMKANPNFTTDDYSEAIKGLGFDDYQVDGSFDHYYNTGNNDINKAAAVQKALASGSFSSQPVGNLGYKTPVNNPNQVPTNFGAGTSLDDLNKPSMAQQVTGYRAGNVGAGTDAKVKQYFNNQGTDFQGLKTYGESGGANVSGKGYGKGISDNTSNYGKMTRAALGQGLQPRTMADPSFHAGAPYPTPAAKINQVGTRPINLNSAQSGRTLQGAVQDSSQPNPYQTTKRRATYGQTYNQIGEALPTLYNLGMGAFGQADTIGLNRRDSEVPEYRDTSERDRNTVAEGNAVAKYNMGKHHMSRGQGIGESSQVEQARQKALGNINQTEVRRYDQIAQAGIGIRNQDAAFNAQQGDLETKYKKQSEGAQQGMLAAGLEGAAGLTQNRLQRNSMDSRLDEQRRMDMMRMQMEANKAGMDIEPYQDALNIDVDNYGYQTRGNRRQTQAPTVINKEKRDKVKATAKNVAKKGLSKTKSVGKKVATKTSSVAKKVGEKGKEKYKSLSTVERARAAHEKGKFNKSNRLYDKLESNQTKKENKAYKEDDKAFNKLDKQKRKKDRIARKNQ